MVGSRALNDITSTAGSVGVRPALNSPYAARRWVRLGASSCIEPYAGEPTIAG